MEGWIVWSKRLALHVPAHAWAGLAILWGQRCAHASFINSSLLGPKEFREVLRYLAMDEPPLLSSSSAVDVPTQGSRKRKFVEVPSDTLSDDFGTELYKFGTSVYVSLDLRLDVDAVLTCIVCDSQR